MIVSKRRKQEVSIGDSWLSILIKLIALLPITTLFQGISVLNAVNQVLILCICFVAVCSLTKIRINISTILVFCLLIPLTVYCICITKEDFGGINTLIYLLVWVFILGLVISAFDELYQAAIDNTIYIDKVVTAWSLLVFLSAFFPSSYNESGYFGSYPGNSFRTNSAASLILVLLIFNVSRNREKRHKYLACSIVVLYCGLEGSSRTYFAVLGILLIIFLACYFENVAHFRACLIVLAIVGFLGISFTTVGKRLFAAYDESAYLGYFGTLTSGRSIFWEADINYYLNQPLIHKLFGSGFSAIYSINEKAIGNRIWAHNDFINVLVTYGLSGMICYFIPLFGVFKLLYKQIKTNWILIFIVICWLINAFFNMVYTYTCAAMSLAILPLALRAYIDNNPNI